MCLQADGGHKNMIMLATSALLADKSVTVRYADGATRTAQFQTILSMKLNR
jgi:hypothetical protein